MVVSKGKMAVYEGMSSMTPLFIFDLMLFSVKPSKDTEFKYSLLLVSPFKNISLGFKEKGSQEAWLKSIANEISYQLDYGNDHPFGNEENQKNIFADPKHPLFKVRDSIPSNKICVDCGQEDPTWASINLGVLMCIQCSGVHRSLGVHLSQVRSLTLDKHVWDNYLVRLMRAIGNEKANLFWEEKLSSSDIKKITPKSSSELRSEYIKSKYEKKLFLCEFPFLKQLEEAYSIDLLFFETFISILSENQTNQDCIPKVLLQLLCAGANPHFRDENENTILHFTAKSKHLVLSEWLIRLGLDANTKNINGQTPLSISIESNNEEMIEYFTIITKDSSLVSTPRKDSLSQEGWKSAQLNKQKPTSKNFLVGKKKNKSQKN